MKSKTHNIRLTDNGLEKIETAILKIENLAYDGVFSDKNTASRFQQIISETKILRRTLIDLLLNVPNINIPENKGDVA